jgi:toxin YoeB
MYEIVFKNRAHKDYQRVERSHFRKKVKEILTILENNPYQTPPFFEKLSGDMDECYSRRINDQHRLVYTIDDEEQCVCILRMWTHYEN